jgi:DNA primase small subunit
MAYDAGSLPDLLPIYYKRIFPCGPYYRWLNYGGVPKTYFSHREFSFTLKDDVYVRYLSFADQQEFEKELQKRCPYKIDIGAVFSHRPKDHKTVKPTSFQALEKELVFDIDMTDYDDVRSCCSGADICNKCWPLMAIAVKIIDRALRDDFGYEHILWVYSGRRGVHCWVCDEGARKLSQNGRSAVAEYLTLIKGGESQVKKVVLPPSYMHPSIQRAISIIDDEFKAYAIDKQDFLGDEEKRTKVLSLIPDDELCKDIVEFLGKFSDEKLNSNNCWQAICEHHTLHIKSENSKKDVKKPIRVLDEIKLQYCYPRLDVNVSKGINHLLKSPFCVHPKTGRVCVPMDHEKIDAFQPSSVPTISQLCDELNEKPSGDTAKRRVSEVRLTSLREGLDVFERFVRKLESSWRGQLIAESDKTGEF